MWDGSDVVVLLEILVTDDFDVKYILEVVVVAKKEFNVDEKCIYVVGIVIGGFMVSCLVCEKFEFFCGVVFFVGGMFFDVFRCCLKSGEINVFFVYGIDDYIVFIDGGVNV